MAELSAETFKWVRKWINADEKGIDKDFELSHPDGSEIFFESESSSYQLTIPVFTGKPHTLSLRCKYSYTAEFQFEFGDALTEHFNQLNDSGLKQLVRYTHGEIMANYAFDAEENEDDIGHHLIGQIWTNGKVTAAITGYFKNTNCATITWNALKFNSTVFFADKQRVL